MHDYILYVYSLGNGEKFRQPLPHPLSGFQLPIPGSLHHEPRDGGTGAFDWHRPTAYQPLHGRVYLQIQFRPQAVLSHPIQNHVHERGRLHHPQPTVAEQATRDAQKARNTKVKADRVSEVS